MLRPVLLVSSVCILARLVILPFIVILVWKAIISLERECAPTAPLLAFLATLQLDASHAMLGTTSTLPLMSAINVRCSCPTVDSARLPPA